VNWCRPLVSQCQHGDHLMTKIIMTWQKQTFRTTRWSGCGGIFKSWANDATPALKSASLTVIHQSTTAINVSFTIINSFILSFHSILTTAACNYFALKRERLFILKQSKVMFFNLTGDASIVTKVTRFYANIIILLEKFLNIHYT
jgi:hypothetical protein